MNAFPDVENDRLALIRSMDLLKSVNNPELERIADLASHAFSMPTVLISLVDRDEQIFLCRIGFEAERTDRSISVCTHAIQQRGVFEVDDLTLDARFKANPLVISGPRIRFYAGAPLITASGHAIGTICLIDYEPRTLTERDRQRLQAYAGLVVDQLSLRRLVGRVDAVTGRPNRQQFMADFAAPEVADQQQAALYLVEFIDVHSAHLLSQSRGMQPIESLIRQACQRIREALPQACELYHVAVARFAFVLPHGAEHPEQPVVQRLCGAFAAPMEADGLRLNASIRIGVAPFDRRPCHDVLRRAICAMQEAIERDRPYSRYDPDYDASKQRALGIAIDADRALVQGEFHLVYQPRYNVRQGTFGKAEVLLRWRHPTLGELSPGEFIPLLQKTAVMPRITDWVIEQALAQLAKWRQRGLEMGISINVTAADVTDGALAARLQQTLARHQLPPAVIELEITEGEWLKPGGSAAIQLAALRASGVCVSLDDFGAGFCNFGYLPRLPIDGLKIDRALVSNAHADPVLGGVAQAILRLAHVMGLNVVAEGVETPDERRFFEREGCDEIQGYLFSRPLPAEDCFTFINTARDNASMQDAAKALPS
ncbi:EAL domain-containing protein [Pseudoxanthomonas sp. JBR18]|uniref:putative bifunctional diguanylate cyclase/phosphodiesterase n=1 Tax=Pseudoxanthomonas sp. JBR18 TaxID=2969308 RepID=UPI002305D6EA|nr:EAL domain-containing protein [Pseudoxanthomonas sp. JBR18]WCE06259.1 EAL domain-containing protein [Pseudoxanthomonas sp. JBR18]